MNDTLGLVYDIDIAVRVAAKATGVSEETALTILIARSRARHGAAQECTASVERVSKTGVAAHHWA